LFPSFVAPVAIVRSTPVAVVPMARWLLVQWLQELSFVVPMAILIQSTPVSVVRYPVPVVALQCYRSTPEAVVPVAPVLFLFQWLQWLSFDQLRWLSFDFGGCCRCSGSNGQTTPVAPGQWRSTPVAVVSIDSSGCRSIDSSGCRSSAVDRLVNVVPASPVAVVRSTPVVAVVPVLSISSLTSFQCLQWPSFD